MLSSLKKIAVRLSRYPELKRFLKFTYQLVTFIFNFHRNKYLGKFEIEKISGGAGGFFGYYDKSPESPDGSYIVYHEILPGYAQCALKKVAIILYDVRTRNRKQIYQTPAFNFQIGARLQWINHDNFIFNSYDQGTGNYFSLIYNISTNAFQRINQAVFDTFKSTYLSLSFNNLNEVGSEYGYSCRNSNHSEPFIAVGDLQNNTSKVIISLDALKLLVPHVFERTFDHHFNHLMFSPDGSKFIFIMRWMSDLGRKELLALYDLSTMKCTILNYEMTSHCCWVDDNRILGYMNHNGIAGYFFIAVNTGEFSSFNIDKSLGDGHPSWKNNLVLVDAYPNSARMQNLMLISSGKVLLAGSFYSPLTYHESNRCDLHPRFNTSGDCIYIDSKHEGTRHLYKVKLKTNG